MIWYGTHSYMPSMIWRGNTTICRPCYGTVTQLYAVHDQDRKTARTFISDCCNRRRSKHSTVSCVIIFVNCLQSVSVDILMENILILCCGGGGVVVCFVSFQVPLTSHASPWRAGGTKNDVAVNRTDF